MAKTILDKMRDAANKTAETEKALSPENARPNKCMISDHDLNGIKNNIGLAIGHVKVGDGMFGAKWAFEREITTLRNQPRAKDPQHIREHYVLIESLEAARMILVGHIMEAAVKGLADKAKGKGIPRTEIQDIKICMRLLIDGASSSQDLGERMNSYEPPLNAITKDVLRGLFLQSLQPPLQTQAIG